jgi:hypothetical protein
MSKFLTGKPLSDAIYEIIWGAEVNLLIVSPFIKLDNHFKKLFDKHENNPNLHLILVFGKNEKEVKKSMSKEDFDYFKKFPRVTIIHVPNLHAKYYGNEKQGVITSVNLYDYSFINNIEFGVFSEQGIMDRFSQSADNEAWNECLAIADKNQVVFIKRPIFKYKRGLFSKSKIYVDSEVLFDSTEKYYGSSQSGKVSRKRLSDFPEELEYGQKFESGTTRKKTKTSSLGYCIRSGVEIKFNLKQPMTNESWKKWTEFGNEYYPEKYCHKTGKTSNGKTSVKHPILR